MYGHARSCKIMQDHPRHRAVAVPCRDAVPCCAMLNCAMPSRAVPGQGVPWHPMPRHVVFICANVSVPCQSLPDLFCAKQLRTPQKVHLFITRTLFLHTSAQDLAIYIGQILYKYTGTGPDMAYPLGPGPAPPPSPACKNK